MISPRQSFHSARNPLHRRKARRGPTSRKTRVGFCRSFRTRCRLDYGLFLQHDDRPGLMTKREVRVQVLADLELPARGVLWDLGAGVGSIGLEALRLRPSLALWALERRGGSAALIAANAERLG